MCVLASMRCIISCISFKLTVLFTSCSWRHLTYVLVPTPVCELYQHRIQFGPELCELGDERMANYGSYNYYESAIDHRNDLSNRIRAYHISREEFGADEVIDELKLCFIIRMSSKNTFTKCWDFISTLFLIFWKYPKVQHFFTLSFEPLT